MTMMTLLKESEVLDALQAAGFISKSQMRLGLQELLSRGIVEPETVDEVVDGLPDE